MTVAAGRFSAISAFEPGQVVPVHVHGSVSLAPLYTDKISGTAAPNPVTADGLGTIQFFASPGDVDLIVTTPGGLSEVLTVTVPADPTQAWPG